MGRSAETPCPADSVTMSYLWVMCLRVPVFVFLMALLVTACSGTDSSSVLDDSSMASALSSTTSAPGLQSVVLPCGEAIGVEDVAPADFTVVLDVVALPASPRYPSALQTSASGIEDPAARLFAKTGLLVRRDAEFELTVGEEDRARLSIGWGSPADRTWQLSRTRLWRILCRVGGLCRWLLGA